MTVDLNRPSGSFFRARTEWATVHPCGPGTGSTPVVSSTSPRMLLLLREPCDGMIEVRPGPDHPGRHGRPAARLHVAPTPSVGPGDP